MSVVEQGRGKGVERSTTRGPVSCAGYDQAGLDRPLAPETRSVPPRRQLRDGAGNLDTRNDVKASVSDDGPTPVRVELWPRPNA